ncbi:protein of unknown function [Nitrospina watsonii]|uniref:Uncharacterized protein n=1 Tax=Nitrospina watsonii TaxID=1323948 RepID=A0ABM9HEL4_9BACT|nr:protein of unknown function [Nitrospina watsonii]
MVADGDGDVTTFTRNASGDLITISYWPQC